MFEKHHLNVKSNADIIKRKSANIDLEVLK